MIEMLVFSAKWCAPCRAMKPAVHDVEESYPEVKVTRVDIDENEDKTAQYEIRAVPTVVVLKDGGEMARHTGACSRQALEDLVRHLI